MFALFFEGKQVGKEHSTRIPVMIEAYEQHAIVYNAYDFVGDRGWNSLAPGYEIKEIPPAAHIYR